MTITKADLAQKVANDCGFMGCEVMEIVDKSLEIMMARLEEGKDAMISDLGTDP